VVDVFTRRGGYSPSLEGNVFEMLLRRTPVTAELALYSFLMFIPFGIAAGLHAGWRPGERFDLIFRTMAYAATSLPPFVVALVLLGAFYVFVDWFPPGRLSAEYTQAVRSAEFHSFTGMLTIDSLLNGRVDIFIDAGRHLVLPVITLSLLHLATLGRIVRSSVLLERRKDYLTAARAHGVPEKRVQWRHALRNILSPALSSSALAAASLFTGVFMVEIIFDMKGVADLVVKGASLGMDVPLTMGFSIYSVTMVLVVMFVLDILRAVFDPRAREGLTRAGIED
jgi:peptide/nickel transport system permease protein